MLRGYLGFGIIVLLVAAWPALGLAGEYRAARLDYAKSADAGRCPDVAEIKNTVAARLGYDPFREDAAATVVARIRREDRGLVANVELRNAAGVVTGSRHLNSNTTDCTELASAVALAISIAIDPLQLSRPPVVAAPVLAAVAPVVKAVPVERVMVLVPPTRTLPKVVLPAPPVPRRAVLFRSDAVFLVSFGSAPNVAFGVAAQAGFRVGAFSLSVEGRGDFPSAGTTALGGVQSSLLVAGVVPCFHYSVASACAVGYAGALSAEATGTSSPRADSSFYAAAGIRLAVELRLYRLLYARLQADLLAAIVRPDFQINMSDAWRAPPLSGVVGAGLGVHY